MSAVAASRAKDGLASRGAQVQGQAALVAVEGEEAGGKVAGEAGTHPAGVVAAAGPLDFDDIGAQVGQQQGAHRAGHNLGQVEDFDAGQGAGGRGGVGGHWGTCLW